MHNQEFPLYNTQSLVEALQNPDLYEHPVASFSILETHISWIILTGKYAYKIKKTVNFGFVDFSTLEKRQFFCEEELRLNSRFSNDLYLGVVAIRGSQLMPQLKGDSKIIEYAVKMREFSQTSLLSSYAAENRLNSTHIDSMADMIADIHERVPHAEAGSKWGSAESIQKWSNENFQQIESAIPQSYLPTYFTDLKAWCRKNFNRLRTTIDQRQQNEFVRECHGDLHLGNMAFLNNRCTAFDCIEFNEELRWIDTISEVAFVVMDLQARGYEKLSWRFLNHYLAITGDYETLSLLSYYVVYRALVRAKVEALLVCTSNSANSLGRHEYRRSMHFLDLAQYWSQSRSPRLIIMHGLSGSGKSTVAENLASRLGAIQIRSDVERKRLFNLDANSDSASSIDRGIYGRDAGQQTYSQLANIAGNLLSNGINVIVDAACLKSSQRDLFRRLALKHKLPFFLISCLASEKEMKRRITQRLKLQRDASEASHKVLENQLITQQNLSTEELENPDTLVCNQPQLSDDQFKKISASTHN